MKSFSFPIQKMVMGILPCMYIVFVLWSFFGGYGNILDSFVQYDLIIFLGILVFPVLTIFLYSITPRIFPYQKRWMILGYFTMIALAPVFFVDNSKTFSFVADGTIFFSTIMIFLLFSDWALSPDIVAKKEEEECEIIEV